MYVRILSLLVAAMLFSACSKEAKTEEHHDDEPRSENIKEKVISTVASVPDNGTPAIAGTVESNAEKLEHATPLVSGRIEKVFVTLGQKVKAGEVLAVITSPLIAQMHGKLHEAETKLHLAEREYERVTKAENRADVLKAKAKLNEADANLTRAKSLATSGILPAKELLAEETSYNTAKAEYEFQSNIALNKQIAEAKAALETNRVDVMHTRTEMKSLGAEIDDHDQSNHNKDTSLIALRSPVSGTVIERLVNPGAGIEIGKSLFTIADLSTLWVIASVPESYLKNLKQGLQADIHTSQSDSPPLNGKISYIDPQLNEDTRTAKVRIEIPNNQNKLKIGMFVNIVFKLSGQSGGGKEND